jgi:hypothetical protein
VYRPAHVFLLAILLGLSSVDVERLDAALREPRLHGSRPKDLAFKIMMKVIVKRHQR